MKAKSVISIDEMEDSLRDIGFFVGGLSDYGIKYYYNKLINQTQ